MRKAFPALLLKYALVDASDRRDCIFSHPAAFRPETDGVMTEVIRATFELGEKDDEALAAH